MKDNCAWCGQVEEVYAWRESVDQDDNGNEIHAPICRECYLTCFEDDDEYAGINEGFRIASEKLGAITRICDEWNKGGYENSMVHMKKIISVLTLGDKAQ